MKEERPVTVIVRRQIKPGREKEFEKLMQQFMQFALSFPGHREIHVLRASEPNPRVYTVVDTFKDVHVRESFKQSGEYRAWMNQLEAVTEGEPHINELQGLAGWFTLPGVNDAGAPAKYKMALVTFLGVYPLTSLLPGLFKNLLPGWHPLIVNVLTSGLIVAALTWLIMPALTRLFSPWLFSEKRMKPQPVMPPIGGMQKEGI